jgi:hypothetical protein
MERDKGLTAGKQLYFELVDRGYPTAELPPSVMARYVIHLSHATDPVVIHDPGKRRRALRKIQWRIDRVMNMDWVQDLLRDDSLDR